MWEAQQQGSEKVRDRGHKDFLKSISLTEALDDEQLLGCAHISGDSWATWRAILKATFGEALTDEELDIFRSLTKRQSPPSKRPNELWVVAGRGAGKSLSSAVIACYLACLVDYSKYLKRPGDHGTLPIIASDKQQARTVFRYIKGILEESPALSHMISNVVDSKSERAIEIDPRELWGGNAKPISIEVHTSSYRSVRGYSIVGAVLDELAFWDTDPFGANSDEETLAAIKAGMRTRVPDGLLVAISSPYSRKGVLWETYDQHFGQENDDVLVVQGASRDFNPTIPEALVSEEIEKDEAKASSEYLGLFRRDIDTFVSKDVLTDCLDGRTSEHGYVEGIQYSAFVDPAGGSGSDSFTLAIGHSEIQKDADGTDVNVAVLDLVREVRPNFSPETVIAEFCQVLKSYRIGKVVGDRYAGSFPSEQFEKRGIRYEPSSLSASGIYREALALFNSRKVRLVRNNRLLSQLASLERRTSRRGDIIDHPAGGHDDLAVACCGVLLEVTGNGQSLSMTALAAGWAQRSDDALLKELPLERQSAAYAYESSQWTDLTFEGRNWSARRR